MFQPKMNKIFVLVSCGNHSCNMYNF